MAQNIIAPSILSADFSNIKSELEMLNKSEADWIHIDVMDGVFVPNLTFGMPIIKSFRKHTNKCFDVHLMIVQPERYIEDFANAGADILTVHYEACTHLYRTIQLIKKNGMKIGIALNPHSSVFLLDDVIAEIDLVCIMSVNPGFGGQSFIENTYNKIKQLKKFATIKNPDLYIEIDGGVNIDNINLLRNAGANTFVSGNFIFKSENPIETIKKMKNLN